jgi:hypothetical protein
VSLNGFGDFDRGKHKSFIIDIDASLGWVEGYIRPMSGAHPLSSVFFIPECI